MKILKILFLFSLIISLEGCPFDNHNADPQIECVDPKICAKVVDIPSGGSCSGNTPLTVVSNDNIKPITVSLEEDTLIENNWVWDGQILQRTTLQGNSGTPIDCGFQYNPLTNQYYRYKRWKIVAACFTDDPKCEVGTQNITNLGLPPNEGLSNFKEGKKEPTFFNINDLISADQKSELKELFTDLITSNTVQKNFHNNIFHAFFPSVSNSNTEVIINQKELQSTGEAFHIQPLLPYPVHFPNSNETYRKLWVDGPNIIEGKILRTPKLIDVKFPENQLSNIITSIQLDPSNKIRKDVIRHLYVLPGTGTLMLSGDFLCICISGLN